MDYRLHDRKATHDIVDILNAVDVPTSAISASTFDGTEIMLGPTQNVAAAALRLAEMGLQLEYDGQRVFVVRQPHGLPVQQFDEKGRIPDQFIEADDTVITDAALVVANAAGVDVKELVEEGVGSGADGRITKPDVVEFIRNKRKGPK